MRAALRYTPPQGKKEPQKVEKKLLPHLYLYIFVFFTMDGTIPNPTPNPYEI